MISKSKDVNQAIYDVNKTTTPLITHKIIVSNETTHYFLAERYVDQLDPRLLTFDIVILSIVDEYLSLSLNRCKLEP